MSPNLPVDRSAMKTWASTDRAKFRIYYDSRSIITNSDSLDGAIDYSVDFSLTLTAWFTSWKSM